MARIIKDEEEKPVKLDLKDKKLLFEMDFNARAPFSKLAKKIHVSKQGAEYKVNNLIKKGVIKGFYPVVNVPKLGYIYCRLSVTLQKVTKEKNQEIINYLINHDKVFWLFQIQGAYDLFFVIWAKSITEFKNFIEEFESEFGDNIKRKEESIATDVIHFQHRYLLGIKETKEIHIRERTEQMEIDELDKKILNCLCSDGRKPLVNIAAEVKESSKVIAYRIKKLEEKKIIEGYRPIINHNSIGYTYYKVLINLNSISKKELIRLKQYIRDSPFVIYLIEGIGLTADLDIEMMVKTNKQFFEFIENLKFKFPAMIGEYQTIIFMDTLKVKYFPF
ncbi:MAG: winged helix-turn-helix transcriptional regulator [Nanoarchaeota archaeon]|nr:winged helix-turn-helix transcriptional regulator [Nanoarchaeota archaeon]